MKNRQKQARLFSYVFFSVFLLMAGRFAVAADDFEQGLKYYKNGECQKALPLIQKAAEKGNVKAMYQMGEFYGTYFCKNLNIDAAINWYQKAADCGETRAFAPLGSLYGLRGNDAKAARYYWEGATAGDATAQQRLGAICETGMGTQGPQPELAVKWFKKSAEQENPLGMISYAEMLIRGEYAERNDWEAVRWLEKAGQSSTGFHTACPITTYQIDDHVNAAKVLLAYMKETGRGTPRDVEGAIQVYRQFSSEYPLAAYRLGRLYENGEGVSKDMNRAFELYTSASNMVGPEIASSATCEANLRLGQWYANGMHVERNDEKAFSYFQQAAYSNCANSIRNEAFYYIGEFYETGRFVHQDIPVAIKWYVIADRLGHPQAPAKIKELVSSSAKK